MTKLTMTEADGTQTTINLRMSLVAAIECFCTEVTIEADCDLHDEDDATDAAFADSWAADFDFDSYHGCAL